MVVLWSVVAEQVPWVALGWIERLQVETVQSSLQAVGWLGVAYCSSGFTG